MDSMLGPGGGPSALDANGLNGGQLMTQEDMCDSEEDALPTVTWLTEEEELGIFIGTAKRLHSLMIRRPPGIHRFINFAIALPRSPLGRASKLI